MQKVRVFLYIFFAFLINSEANAYSKKEFSCHDYLIQIAETFKTQIKDELNLVMTGKGFTVHDRVEQFQIFLRTDRRATLEEARTLQLLAIHKLAQIINNHKEIQPYLIETPFTFKHIRISINFDIPFGQYVDGSVAHVCNVAEAPTMPENAHHFFYDAGNPLTGNTIDILKEPYEEALRLAQAFPINNPSVHETTPLEEINEQAFLKFGIDLSENHSLYLSSVGGNYTNNEVEEIGAAFIFFSPTTPEEARKLALLAIEKILNTVNQDPRLKPYLKPYPFPTSALNVHIVFKKMIKGPWGPPAFHDGSMHRVEIKDDVLSYYISPDVKKLSKEREDGVVVNFDPFLVAKETYQEALEAARNTPPK